MEISPGVININKEKGFTSHDVVAIVRKAAGRLKTGHTGTLDPEATGVLPVCLGRATKLADFFAAADKTYIAEVILGVTTDTGDMTGTVLTRARAGRGVDEKTVAAALASFRGEYLQTPPMYSAVKIGGKKLYELARKGQTIERPPRPVIIHAARALDFTLLGGRVESFFIEVTCSKGTYIRSLCADIGAALGCGAAMGDLTRTRSGRFAIEDSLRLAQVKAAAENGRLGELILPVEQALPYPAVYARPGAHTRAANGNPLPLSLTDGPPIETRCWLKAQGRLVGLFVRDKDILRPEVML